MKKGLRIAPRMRGMQKHASNLARECTALARTKAPNRVGKMRILIFNRQTKEALTSKRSPT
jgi:hypothetical protein